MSAPEARVRLAGRLGPYALRRAAVRVLLVGVLVALGLSLYTPASAGAQEVCDSDGMHASFNTSYSATAPAGYKVMSVTIEGIASGCSGKEVRVNLTRGGSTVASGSGSLASPTTTVTIDSPPLAVDVTGIHVEVPGFVSTATPTSTVTPTPMPSPTPTPTMTPTATPTLEATSTPPPVPEEPSGPPPEFPPPVTSGDVLPTATTAPPRAVVSPSPVGTPRATSSPAPSSTPRPSATAVAPRPTTPPVTGGAAAPTPTPPPPNPARSQFARNVPTLSDLSTSPATIATNLTLSLGAFLLILLACGVFNETLKENGAELSAMLSRLPLIGGMFMAPAAHVPQPVRRGLSFGFLKPISMLALLGVIYSALDPAFGFNTTTLALLISLAIALGFLTTVFEGGKVLVTSRFYRASGTVRLHPLGIGVAVVSVALSKLIDMHPGIVLGFVAGAVVNIEDPRRGGPITFVPMVALFVFSLVALGLQEPLRTYSDHSGEWYAVIPETVAVTIFIAGVEGLLFQLMPLTFMEGRTVWDWSKLAWLLIAVPVGFVFFHVIVNREHAYDAAVEDSSVQALFALCGLFLLMSGVFWVVCRFWLPEHEVAESHA